MSRFVLYHDWDSFKSVKVRICLSEKEIDWTSKIVSLAAFDHFGADYLAMNPAGVIPILVADGTVVRESTIINEFLDDISERLPLKPKGAFERAEMRLWARFEDEVVHPAVRVPTFNLVTKRRVQALKAEEFERMLAMHPVRERAEAYRTAISAKVDDAAIVEAIKTIAQIVERMEITLQKSHWLAGDSYSLADVSMTAFIDRIEVLGLEPLWNGRRKLEDWIARIKARPSYAVAMPPANKRMASPDSEVIRSLLKHA